MFVRYVTDFSNYDQRYVKAEQRKYSNSVQQILESRYSSTYFKM